MSIWTASSRVGETMTAFAGELDGVWGVGAVVMERMQGTPKARVLPEPVSAMPTTSRPERRKGQAADWMGVGVLKPANGDGFDVVVVGRCAKLVMGRRVVVESGSLIEMKFFERKSSISGWGSAVRAGSSL